MAGETVDGRRLFGAVGVVVVAVAALAGLARLAGADGSGSEHRTAAVERTLPPSESSSSSSSSSSTQPALPEEPPADFALPDVPGHDDPDFDGEPPDDLEDAFQVARDFAIAYSTYRFDEPPEAPLDRARPFLTEEAAEALSENSGAVFSRSDLEARQEVAEATIDATITEGFSEDRVGVTVVVDQRITTTEGTTANLISYHLTVVRTDDGWLVAQVGVL
ncbi:MAG: hypothetical protein ACRD0U_06270 [Acidimicrobiales bacterium]